MSEYEDQIAQEPTNYGGTPGGSYRTSDPPPPADTEAFGSDAHGLRDAADERMRTSAESAPELIQFFDRETGKVADGDRDVSKGNAADQLTAYRQERATQAAAQESAELAQAVDEFRQSAQPTEQPQHEPQAEQPHIEQPQPEYAPEPPGELDQLLAAVPAEQRQRIVHGPQQYVGQVQNGYSVAQQQLAEAANFVVAKAEAAIIKDFPALQGIGREQIPAAVAILQKQNPQEYQRLVARVQQDQTENAAVLQAQHAFAQQAAQQQQAQQAEQARQFEAWKQQQDERVPTYQNLPEIQKEVYAIAQEHGISKQELAQLYENNPVMRHAAFQTMMAELAQFRLAKKAVTQAKVTPIAKVQRPGTSGEAALDRSELSSLQREFNLKPSSKLGAQLLAARRGSR